MSDGQLVRLLRALSNRGSRLEAGANDTAGRCAIYVLQHADSKAEVTRFSADVVRHALAENYLCRDAGRRLTLSVAGRSYIRRLTSTGETPEASAPSPHTRSVDAVTARTPPRSESPLSWLHTRKDKDGRPLISDVEFAAGERLRIDYERAMQLPSTTANWGSAGSEPGRNSHENAAADRLDRTIAARARVERALEAMDGEVAGLVVDVCCHGMGLAACEKSRGLSPRSSKHLLAIGLRALAGHYGLSSRRVRASFDTGSGRVEISACQ